MRRLFACLICSCLVLICSPAPQAQTALPHYTYTGNITFDITKVPFSRYGSYLAVSRLPNREDPHAVPGVYLRSMHENAHTLFRLELTDGDTPVPFQVEATPVLLSLRAEHGSVEICIPEGDQVRIHGQGVSLRLVAEPDTLAVPGRDQHWEINPSMPQKHMLWPIHGSLHVIAPWTGTGNSSVSATFSPDPASHQFDAEIDTYPSVWTRHSAEGSFTASVQRVQADYRQWLAHMPQIPAEYGQGGELAAYIDWASVVAPSGNFKRPAMLMSKNWMAAVWSWDHCFNAMALSYKDPQLAWQQFMVPFDDQEIHGALPDMVRESLREFGFSKPPIHGWVLDWMMRQGDFTDADHLRQIYQPLARWTDWYFRYRDSNGDGLPEYNHGNDSGWDNSTVMLSGVPVESPDLDSFLILQMDALAKIARKLDKAQEADAWQQRSDRLLKQMLATFWKVDHFVALRATDGKEIDADSLLLYRPLILGKRLPPDVRQKLIAGLTRQGRFRTRFGFASEALGSSYYTPDGYWRGPIWAPTSMILAEGLDASGEHQLAHQLRADFCHMAQTSGMSENFDALTGEGLRDPAYTWTSSVYLIFAHQLWMDEGGHPAPAASNN